MPKKGELVARTSYFTIVSFPRRKLLQHFNILYVDMDVTGLEMVSEVTDGQGDSSSCYLAIHPYCLMEETARHFHDPVFNSSIFVVSLSLLNLYTVSNRQTS